MRCRGGSVRAEARWLASSPSIMRAIGDKPGLRAMARFTGYTTAWLQQQPGCNRCVAECGAQRPEYSKLSQACV